MPRLPARPRQTSLLVLLLFSFGGCGKALPQLAGLPAAGPRDTDLTGVWDLVVQRIDEAGDTCIERHEWQLQHQGQEVVGFWNFSRTWVSGDGVPFVCSGQPRYTESFRHLVRGQPAGTAARVVVTPWSRAPGPCQSRRPVVQGCLLARRGPQRLLAHCGRSWMSLQRRTDKPVPLELAAHRPGSLTGVWTWNLRSTDSEGDLKLETETWHLRQNGAELEGHYDRLVRVRSSDGRRFQCNQELQYVSRARFRVRGTVQGTELRIEETGFSAAPDRCETGYRSLDRYRGRVDARGEIITLSWGRGAQLLYRRY